MQIKDIVALSLSAFIAVLCFVFRFLIKPRSEKKKKRKNTLTMLGAVAAAWYFVGTLLNILSGRDGITLSIPDLEMFSDRVEIFGVSLARTTVVTYVMIGVILILALCFRIFAVPKFKIEKPTKLQNVFEALQELIDGFVKSVIKVELGDGITSFMYTVGVFMMGCALCELFGQRAPTSDLLTTLSLALCTFFLINYYGIKQKGIFGRIKFLASPSPILLPMKVLSDCAVPVSLACRLFGNMLGGLIVMELLRASLGGYSAGLSSLLGIYFNLAHPLIQTYVFIVLSLTFINEAAEDAEE